MDIEYKYLNMDTGAFCDSQEELTKQVGCGGIVKAIPAAIEHNQVLFAASVKSFTDMEAIVRCRRLSGLL